MIEIDVMERLIKSNDAINELDDALYNMFCVSLILKFYTFKIRCVIIIIRKEVKKGQDNALGLF